MGLDVSTDFCSQVTQVLVDTEMPQCWSLTAQEKNKLTNCVPVQLLEAAD